LNKLLCLNNSSQEKEIQLEEKEKTEKLKHMPKK